MRPRRCGARKYIIPTRVQSFALVFTKEGISHLRDLRARQIISIGENNLTVDAEGRRHPHDEVQIRGAQFSRGTQKMRELVTHRENNPCQKVRRELNWPARFKSVSAFSASRHGD